MKITTTLNQIKKHKPCKVGWEKLLLHLGKVESDDEELNLLTILKSNGVKDCLWAFKCTDDNESVYRNIAADFAESVLHIFEKQCFKDNRPRLAIQAARDYADSKISDAARAAKAAGAAKAADAAGASAWFAAAWAAGAAAWAARSAGAAEAADAAGAAARSAAGAAEAAAWAAGAAGAAAWAAEAALAAAWAGRSAGAAAGAAAWADEAAEIQKQKQIILKYLSF